MVHYFKLQGHATFIPVFELIWSDMVHCFKLQNQATFVSSIILNHKIMHFVPIFELIRLLVLIHSLNFDNMIGSSPMMHPPTRIVNLQLIYVKPLVKFEFAQCGFLFWIETFAQFHPVFSWVLYLEAIESMLC